MNTDAYSLSDSVVSVGGNTPVPQAVDDFAKKYIAGHYLIVGAILLVLTILVLWLFVWKCVEKFNPTSTLRMQQRDGLGESMDGGSDRASSVFAQQAQSGGTGQFNIDPNAKPNQPGSLAWQVLHSADFDCNKRQSVGDDAWSWLNNVAHESMDNKPKNDNDFSRVLAGH